MNEWKFEVGVLIEDKFNKYVISELDQVKNGYWISLKGKVYFISKDLIETDCELVKPKTLFEQALALIGLEVEQEFEFEFNNMFGMTNIFKFSSNGTLWNKTRTGWQTTRYGLHTILTSGKLPKIHKPKSEAELILDELEKVVDKANEVLRKSGR